MTLVWHTLSLSLLRIVWLIKRINGYDAVFIVEMEMDIRNLFFSIFHTIKQAQL
jgi:hypothetical protein